MTDRELLLERLERLAIVLDEIMPRCAELVRDAIALINTQYKLILELQNLISIGTKMMNGDEAYD